MDDSVVAERAVFGHTPFLFMDTPANILVATGAFKDVFSPSEAGEMISKAIRSALGGSDSVRVEIVPMADGGEFSDEVLASHCGCRRIWVGDSVDPRGEPMGAEYLALDDGTAFIASAQALGLLPAHYRYKNPLNLTSYGLGQLIQHAAHAGFKKLTIGMGGTSTVDAGIGMAQALGVRFLDSDGAPLEPRLGAYLTGGDLDRVGGIVQESVPSYLADLAITVLCDTRISVSEMQVPTEMKIGKLFDSQRASILATLQGALRAYCELLGDWLSSRDLHLDGAKRDLFREDSLGVAGGVVLSLLAISRPQLVPGVEFFVRQLQLKDAVVRADLVVTGEGRFDISLEGKTPAGVSALARRYGKPVLLVCGSVSPSLKSFFDSAIARRLPSEITAAGITAMISCHERFDSIQLPKSYDEEMAVYRRETPIVLAEKFRAYFERQEEMSS